MRFLKNSKNVYIKMPHKTNIFSVDHLVQCYDKVHSYSTQFAVVHRRTQVCGLQNNGNEEQSDFAEDPY